MKLDINELQILRSSLDIIDLKGSNAQYLANLQLKLEQEILRIKELKREEDLKLSPPELKEKKENKNPVKKQ